MIKLADNTINKIGAKIKHKKRDKIVEKLHSALKSSDGLTITELVKKTKLNRSSIRTALAKLDGAERVIIRKIGMAKIYSLNKRRKEK